MALQSKVTARDQMKAFSEGQLLKLSTLSRKQKNPEEEY
jgi:hypothetical protein